MMVVVINNLSEKSEVGLQLQTLTGGDVLFWPFLSCLQREAKGPRWGTWLGIRVRNSRPSHLVSDLIGICLVFQIVINYPEARQIKTFLSAFSN